MTTWLPLLLGALAGCVGGPAYVMAALDFYGYLDEQAAMTGRP